MIINKDNIEVSVGLAYKVHMQTGYNAAKSGVDQSGRADNFWQSVKEDAKMLLKTSAEIMKELREEKGV